MAPYMQKQKSGKIVTVSSVAGVEAMTGYHPYGTAKAAIIYYTRALAQELAPYNVTVNCIAPAIIRTGRLGDRSHLAEKIPLILLVIPVSAATYAAQAKAGAVSPNPLTVNLANAVVSYAAYLGKTVWPADLAAFYPLDPARIAAWKVGASALLILTISAAVAVARRPYLAVGWCWYLGTLVPVIGIVQVGSQAMADRHMYIPLVGLFVAGVWGIDEAGRAWRPLGKALPALATLVVLVLAVQAKRQVGVWESNVTLFNHAVSVTSNN